MHRLMTLLTLFALATFPALAAGLPSPYAGTPGSKEYPGADVLVLSELLDCSVAADGRVTLTVHRAEKILTYQGMDVIGDPKVAFHKGDQILQDYALRTYTSEGEVVDAAPNSFTEMTPYELERAPDYTGLREMVLTKVGLDLGAVAESRWTVADQRAWRTYFNVDIPLSDGFPCLERQVRITVPEGTPLKWALTGVSCEPEVRRESGTVLYAWRLRNQASFGISQASGDERAALPRLVATTCPDWKAANGSYARYAEEAARILSPSAEKKADELVKRAATPFQKAVALSTYVAESIPTVHWPLEAFDFRPRSAAKVFDTGYGHALDKAVLLCAMLKRAGIEAAPALCALSPQGFPDPDVVPCVAQFDRVIVHSTVAGETLWLDPTAPLSERSHREFQGYKGLPLVPGIGELHAMTPVGGEDRLWVDLSCALSADWTLEGEGTVVLSGSYSPYYTVQGSAEALKGALGALMGSILPGGEVTDYSLTFLAPEQLQATVKVKGKASSAVRGPVVLAIGTPAVSTLAHLAGMHRGSRDLPYLLPRTGTEELNIQFTLPSGKAPAYLPAGISIPGAAARSDRSWSLKEGKLTFHQILDFPTRVIPPKDFPQFRDLFGRVSATSGLTVLF